MTDIGLPLPEDLTTSESATIPETPTVAESQSQPMLLISNTARAFVLQVLNLAKANELTQGELNRKLRTQAAQIAGIAEANVPAILADLKSTGSIESESKRQTVRYRLTAEGNTQLANLSNSLPPTKSTGNRGKMVPPANEEIRNYRTGWLLMQVLRAPEQSLADAAAGKELDVYARETLELNVATARMLRDELADRGLLGKSGTGKQLRYTLTPIGRGHLGNIGFPDELRFTLTGRILNAMLESAREVGKQFTPPVVSKPPTREELEQAIMDVFADLLREKYQTTELVPIHEVRAVVRERFGESASRHDMFDELVLGLWRQKRLGLTSISDPARVTQEQLQASIPGRGETLFYLEPAHEPVTV